MCTAVAMAVCVCLLLPRGIFPPSLPLSLSPSLLPQLSMLYAVLYLALLVLFCSVFPVHICCALLSFFSPGSLRDNSLLVYICRNWKIVRFWESCPCCFFPFIKKGGYCVWACRADRLYYFGIVVFLIGFFYFFFFLFFSIFACNLLPFPFLFCVVLFCFCPLFLFIFSPHFLQ